MTELSHNHLILSLFPGIDLLGRAFEEAGYCVVRGPDKLWGGDVRRFHPPPGIFWGVIGGSPCQEFSGLFRDEPTGYSQEMLDEYRRCVTEAQPEWWLLENVARVPDCDIAGYVPQRIDVNNGWYSDQTRLRHIQFGSKSGRLLDVPRRSVTGTQPAALANDTRSFRELCRLQGLPDDYDLPPFKVAEKIKAVGNGVPLDMGRVLAKSVTNAYLRGVTVQLTLEGQLSRPDTCPCGCGRPVTPGRVYAGDVNGNTQTCRKRAQRNRDLAKSQNVTHRGVTGGTYEPGSPMD